MLGSDLIVLAIHNTRWRKAPSARVVGKRNGHGERSRAVRSTHRNIHTETGATLPGVLCCHPATPVVLLSIFLGGNAALSSLMGPGGLDQGQVLKNGRRFMSHRQYGYEHDHQSSHTIGFKSQDAACKDFHRARKV